MEANSDFCRIFEESPHRRITITMRDADFFILFSNLRLILLKIHARSFNMHFSCNTRYISLFHYAFLFPFLYKIFLLYNSTL
jgi:hypothetical protein